MENLDEKLATNSDTSKMFFSEKNSFSIDRLLHTIKDRDEDDSERDVEKSSFRPDSSNFIFSEKRCLINEIFSKQVSPIPPSIYVPEGLFGRGNKRKTENQMKDAKARKIISCFDKTTVELPSCTTPVSSALVRKKQSLKLFV